MRDLNVRIKQLTNLIPTSQTVDENRVHESRPASPSKVDFDMTPTVPHPLIISVISPSPAVIDA